MNLQVQYFMTATELTRFVNDVTNAVTKVESITFDTASAKYVLFFT